MTSLIWVIKIYHEDTDEWTRKTYGTYEEALEGIDDWRSDGYKVTGPYKEYEF